MRSKLTVWLYATTCVIIMIVNIKQWQGQSFSWDQAGYQVYLPAVFIYNDIEELSFYKETDSLYKPSGSYQNYSITQLPNGNRINKYTVGVAIHQLPFFLTAHFINTQWLSFRQDGYSLPYEYALRVGNLFWVVLGLFVIRQFLRRHFTENITAITVFIIAFGTNIFYYTTYGIGGAHSYSFFHFAMILHLTELYYSQNKKRYLFVLAIIFGLILLTRPVNIIGVLIPIMWNIHSRHSFSERINFLSKNVVTISISIVIALIVFSPQLLLWKHVTGQWLYDGYTNEGFIWTEPRIFSGLFSFQKGWMIYAPVSVLGLIGIYFMKFHFGKTILTYILFFSVFIYVTYCWWNWWYGGCFGSRPMIDITPLLALPIAALLLRVQKQWHTLAKTTLCIIVCLLIALNIFQSYQYSKGVIHYERMAAKYYFNMFFATQPPTPEEEKLLMSSKEYYGEMAHRYNQVKEK